MAPKRTPNLARPPLERKRSAAVRKDHLKPPAKKSGHASRRDVLERTTQELDLQTTQNRVPCRFTLLDVDLWQPAAKAMKAQRTLSPSSTSNTSEAGGRGKMVKRRRARQSRRLVDGVMDNTDLSLLEKSAVGPQSHKYYTAEMEEFKMFAITRGLDLKDPENVDRLLVDYMNGLYLKGFQAYRGDRLAAAMLHFHPQFGKMGAEKLPRMWRALRGFRKLTPGKSRLAYPLMVWAAVASELRRMGKLRMALFLLVSLSSYARPSELIRLQVYSLVRPSPGVTSSWTLLMSPEERPDRTKTGEFDTSIALDSPYMIPWSHTLFGYLKQTHPSNPLWDFDYNQYCRDFQKAVASLGLDLTPYLTRHSGPSIDRSRGYRSQLEVQKRGQWKSQSSVMRYEKAARLAATTENLAADLQAHCRVCEEKLGAIMLGSCQIPAYVKSK